MAKKDKEPKPKKYKRGLCCGKFWPLHSGHQHLIETTIANSDKPICFVVWRPWERPSGALRDNWIAELYPELSVIPISDPGIDTLEPDQRSKYWARLTEYHIGHAPDAVFTSEEYGARWAEHLGCDHVLVDLERGKFPVSGTLVRRDPKLFWSHLPEPVQEWYTKNWGELEKCDSPADYHIRYPSL